VRAGRRTDRCHGRLPGRGILEAEGADPAVVFDAVPSFGIEIAAEAAYARELIVRNDVSRIHVRARDRAGSSRGRAPRADAYNYGYLLDCQRNVNQRPKPAATRAAEAAAIGEIRGSPKPSATPCAEMVRRGSTVRVC
jgi:hypothetical protein